MDWGNACAVERGLSRTLSQVERIRANMEAQAQAAGASFTPRPGIGAYNQTSPNLRKGVADRESPR